MRVLRGREVVLGVTGGIAAYKSAELVRLLTKAGARVTAVMTRNAAKFITPLTLMTLTERPVVTEMFDAWHHPEIEHIALSDRAEIAVIAPATANIIGKMANGIADDFLSTFLMVVRCPIFVAPAMNTNMYQHPAVQENLQRLAARGVQVIEPGVGELACKVYGPGRMADPAVIVEDLAALAGRPRDLAGRRFLITAGPTRERIDPVRFISNPSSGKMGFALARAARDRGAQVKLISGPTSLPPPRRVEFTPADSTHAMYEAVLGSFPWAEVVIMTAAVADYRTEQAAARKIKKERSERLTLELVRNPDILMELGRRKEHQILVGFAAETDDLLSHGQAKLERKNCDFFAVNDVSRTDSGFGAEVNQVTVLSRGKQPVELPLLPKEELAHELLDLILPSLCANPS